MNKKFAISIPHTVGFDVPRRQGRRTEISDEENPRPLRGQQYIDESASDESEHDKQQKSSEKLGQHYPLVEFEQFTVEKKQPENKQDKKRRYEIDVPQIKFEHANSMVRRENSPDDSDALKEYICKEPPAPSKGSTKAKVFVFPTSQNTGPTKSKKHSSPQEQNEPSPMSKEDFMKEKQRFERELLIKDAQIDLLQKLISEHLSSKPQVTSLHEAQRIILEKDQRHNELLSKLQELSNIIRTKNQEIANLRYQNERLQGLLQGLQHNVYVLAKKEDNHKLTREFLDVKHDDQRHTKSYWQDDRRSSLKQQSCIRNIEDLQKRLEFLKSNRIELEVSKSRQKNKSVLTSIPKEETLWCSMTSKHKPKGVFDFKFAKDRSFQGSFAEKAKKKETY